jgi:hypothetical protein
MKTPAAKCQSDNILQVDRRGFLAGVSVALSGLPLQSFGAATDKAPERVQPQRAVFQQQAYFNFEGSGTTYVAPQGNQATRAYVASISHEEFLRRHWFC